MGYYNESIAIMSELYGHDVTMSLATVNRENRANIGMVDAFYREGAFYVPTHLMSGMMRDIDGNPHVALNYNLFVAHGTGQSIGHPLSIESKALRQELMEVFHIFYGKHVNEADDNTCILKIDLADAVVCAHDYRYTIDFVSRTAERVHYVPDIFI